MACEPVQRAISDGDGRVLRARHMRSHVRGCRSCTALRDSISTRERDLAVLAPVGPGVAGAALLQQVFETAAGTGGAGGAFLRTGQIPLFLGAELTASTTRAA